MQLRTIEIPHGSGAVFDSPAARFGVALGALGVSLSLGLAIGAGHGNVAAAALVLAVALAVGLHDWRWSMFGLLAYLPFSGLATLALYPNQAPGVLAKDVLFVIPAYIGFASAFAISGRRIGFNGAPAALMAVLAALVGIQALNPELSNSLVPLIGIKVWLLYLPLIFLGYHLIRDRNDLTRLLAVMVAAAVVPALIGIAEAVQIYAGHADSVYSLYGDAAGSATQNFAELGLGGIEIRRVPSTFSSVVQYYVFTSAMVAVAYAWWQMGHGRLARRLGGWATALMMVAALLSGARGAFIFVPLLLAILVLLDRGRPSRVGDGRRAVRLWTVCGGLAVAVVVTLSVTGASGSAVPSELLGHGKQQFNGVFITGFSESLGLTTAGLGTGTDTNASRYALDPSELFSATNGRWEESWWVKAVLELGLAGLLIVVALLLTLLARLLARHRRLKEPRLRSASAALLALLVWSVAYNFKAQYVDSDPLNVYFWLFAGILFKLSVIDRGSDKTALMTRSMDDPKASEDRRFAA